MEKYKALVLVVIVVFMLIMWRSLAYILSRDEGVTGMDAVVSGVDLSGARDQVQKVVGQKTKAHKATAYGTIPDDKKKAIYEQKRGDIQIGGADAEQITQKVVTSMVHHVPTGGRQHQDELNKDFEKGTSVIISLPAGSAPTRKIQHVTKSGTTELTSSIPAMDGRHMVPTSTPTASMLQNADTTGSMSQHVDIAKVSKTIVKAGSKLYAGTTNTKSGDQPISTHRMTTKGTEEAKKLLTSYKRKADTGEPSKLLHTASKWIQSA